jgi:hypothetical protein
MPIPTPANLPKAGWAVLLYGPPPEIQLLAGELDDSGLEIVRIGDHFFLQVPEVFAPLSLVCQPETGTRGCCVSQRERAVHSCLQLANRLDHFVKPWNQTPYW